MVVTCDIVFDKNDDDTFYAGELVTGSAILKLDKTKEVKGITLHITGKAETSWSETDTDTDKSSKSYGGHVNYIKMMTYLLGSPKSNNCTIPAGTHNYTFDFQIPYECPSSFEGRDGWIRYVVKISLLRPWKFNQDFKKTFKVIKPLDLNLEGPILKLPTTGTAEKVFCCGPCQTEPLMLEVTLPRTGFVPGEVIPVHAVIINNSNVSVLSMKVSLMMLVRCTETISKISSSSQQTEVASVKGEGVLRYSKKVYDYELVIPPTHATSVNVCEIIEITYEVHVEAEMKGPNADQVIAIPVFIGTLPIRDVVVDQPTTSRLTMNIGKDGKTRYEKK